MKQATMERVRYWSRSKIIRSFVMLLLWCSRRFSFSWGLFHTTINCRLIAIHFVYPTGRQLLANWLEKRKNSSPTRWVAWFFFSSIRSLHKSLFYTDLLTWKKGKIHCVPTKRNDRKISILFAAHKRKPVQTKTKRGRGTLKGNEAKDDEKKMALFRRNTNERNNNKSHE